MILMNRAAILFFCINLSACLKTKAESEVAALTQNSSESSSSLSTSSAQSSSSVQSSSGSSLSSVGSSSSQVSSSSSNVSYVCTAGQTRNVACTSLPSNSNAGTQAQICAADRLSYVNTGSCLATACNNGYVLNSGACTQVVAQGEVVLQYTDNYYDPEITGESAWRTLATPTVGEKSLNLGRVVKGVEGERRFELRIKNATASVVSLTQWSLPVGLKWASDKGTVASVAANSSVIVAVVLDSTLAAGKKFGDLKFLAGPVEHKLTLEFEVKE